MTPNARINAAIAILDDILGGAAAEAALLRWSRGARYAGSGDRAAVRDLVFEALRKRRSLAHLGGAGDGRGLMLGLARARGQDLDALFSGAGHAPAPLSTAERSHSPTGAAPRDLPDWLWPAWQAALGDQAEAVAALMQDRAPVWLRVNPLRATPEAALARLAQDAIAAQPHETLAGALCVTQGARGIARSAAYREGLVELQDLSPQRACAALPLGPRDSVLDYCAGGGGKALALAGRGAGRVVAHDADPRRMADLPARAARAGAQIEMVTRPRGRFDLVVADVPCSGSGTWRRTPDAKWRLTPNRLAQLTAVQARILGDCAALVRPGGHLAYMTCSLIAAENTAQIAAFVAEHCEFRIISQSLMTPAEGGDGFFYAVMEKIDAH